MPTPEEILDRQEQAFSMRLEGKTMTTIARELGVAVSTIHGDLQTIAKMKYQGLIEKDQNLLLEQNAYYDALLERWLPLAMSEDLNVGETRKNNRGEEYDVALEPWKASGEATDKVLKILEGKSKINGLAPQKTDRTPEEVGTSVALAVMEAFRKLSSPREPRPAEVLDIR